MPTPAARAAVPISNDNITDRLAIRRVLDWYAASYSRRDIDAVAAITPDVDTTYLAREFATRERQDLHFRRCLIDVRGSQATARCVGELHYMPRAGVPASRPVRWDFTMAEENRGWVIEDVMRR